MRKKAKPVRVKVHKPWRLRKNKKSNEYSEEQPPEGAVPAAIHIFSIAEGPERANGDREKRRLIQCTKCGWHEKLKDRWKNNAYKLCDGRLCSEITHTFAAEGDGKEYCIRCKIRKDVRSEGRWCRVPTAGDPLLDKWIGYNSRISIRWRHRWEAKTGPVIVNTFSAHTLTLSKRKDHLIIKDGHKVACLDCGKFATSNKAKVRVPWVSEPCAGRRKLPLPLVARLRAGEFDACRVVCCGRKSEPLVRGPGTLAARIFSQLDAQGIEWPN